MTDPIQPIQGWDGKGNPITPAKDAVLGEASQSELREAVKRFCRTDEAADNLVRYINAHTRRAVATTERAYGGCHNCYGKGYSTYKSQVIGYGTDGDIGGYQGAYKQDLPVRIKYCRCERGKALAQLMSPGEEAQSVDRLEVIDETGRTYVRGSIYGSPVSVKLSYQDEGRTLKVFVTPRGGRMKPAFNLNTGHNWELRPKPGDTELANLEWDFKAKEWNRGLRTYFYCTDCRQYAWGAKTMCPVNTEVVLVKVPRVIVKRGAA